MSRDMGRHFRARAKQGSIVRQTQAGDKMY